MHKHEVDSAELELRADSPRRLPSKGLFISAEYAAKGVESQNHFSPVILRQRFIWPKNPAFTTNLASGFFSLLRMTLEGI